MVHLSMCNFSDFNFIVSIEADNILRTNFHAEDWILCSPKCFLWNRAQTEVSEKMLSSSGMRQIALFRMRGLTEMQVIHWKMCCSIG